MKTIETIRNEDKEKLHYHYLKSVLNRGIMRIIVGLSLAVISMFNKHSSL